MDSPEPEVETPPPSLDNLPEELLLKVLRYLPATDLLRFSLTQKRFRALSLDNVLWKGLYASGYPTSYAKHAPRLTSPDANWLELTREAADVAKRFRTGRFHNNITLPGPRDRPSGHSGRVFGVSMLQTSPAHPPHVFSAGDDGYLKLWNLETHECVTSFSNPEDAEGGFFDIRRDMVWGDLKRYFASTFSGRGYILDVFEPGTVTLDGLKAAELKDMLTKRGISSAGCFEKSDLISRIKEFKVDQSSWRIVKRAELGYHMAPCVTIRGYGNTLAFTCSFDGTVQVYSLADMTEPSATAPSQAPLKLSPIMHYAHSRSNTYAINAVVYDGKFMYTSGNDGEIHMSDLGATSIEYGAIPSPTRHRVLNGVNGHRHWIWCLESPKEHMLVSGSVDRTLKVWDVRAATACQHTVEVFNGPIAGLCIKRWDENVVVTGSFDNTVRILDPRMFGAVRGSGRSPVLAELRVPNHSNLTRCDIDSDWIAVACQSSDIHAWNFRRGL